MNIVENPYRVIVEVVRVIVDIERQATCVVFEEMVCVFKSFTKQK